MDGVLVFRRDGELAGPINREVTLRIHPMAVGAANTGVPGHIQHHIPRLLDAHRGVYGGPIKPQYHGSILGGVDGNRRGDIPAHLVHTRLGDGAIAGQLFRFLLAVGHIAYRRRRKRRSINSLTTGSERQGGRQAGNNHGEGFTVRHGILLQFRSWSVTTLVLILRNETGESLSPPCQIPASLLEF